MCDVTDREQSLPEDAVERLVAARREYERVISPSYDDALPEIIKRVGSTGSIGKADLGAVVLWKRLNASTRWATQLMSWPDTDVREVTGAAVTCVRDEARTLPDAAAAGRSKLTGLPGFTTGDALASAVLFIAAPTRMAVYDRRSQAGIERLGLHLSPKPGRYGRYMALVERLTLATREAGTDWQPRDVDLALYWLGRPSPKPSGSL